MRTSRTFISSALALGCGLCLALSACDKGEAKHDELEAAAAAALGEGKDDKSKELESLEAAKRREAFEARKAKEAEEAAKLAGLVEQLVKAPAKAHKNVQAACDDFIKVYADWVKVVYFDDDGYQLNFFDNKSKSLGVVMSKCAKLQSIPATDCMIEVVNGTQPREEFPESDAKLIQAQPDYLFDQCIAKFAPEKLTADDAGAAKADTPAAPEN